LGSKFRLETHIIDALVFYFMLAITLTSGGISEEDATITLREYVDANVENGEFADSERYGKYLEVAYNRIPSSFLHMFNIPTKLGDGIRTIDVHSSWVPKL